MSKTLPISGRPEVERGRRRRALLLVIGALPVAGLLAGCGRKGDLEPPPKAPERQKAPAG